ncbi:MAG: hypothetical protein WB762_19550 [Candidatus Sulfotelmatobacter sp.]
MITQLGGADPQTLGVIARTSAVKFKNTRKDIQEIGRELGVDYVLEGSVRRQRQFHSAPYDRRGFSLPPVAFQRCGGTIASVKTRP